MVSFLFVNVKMRCRGAYVVNERSAVSSVVSIVMLAVLRLMENLCLKGNMTEKHCMKTQVCVIQMD